MNHITRRAWAVLRAAFPDGEFVIVEDCDGIFYRGKLTARNTGILLVRPHGVSHEIDWDDVELIAHDGFPVQPLLGMTRQEADIRAKRTDPSKVRQLLDDKHKLEIDAAYKRGYETGKHIATPRIGGGCPFIAGPLRLTTIHNKGNTGPRFQYSDAGEVLVFQAADGALMHSYDTDHLFLLP